MKTDHHLIVVWHGSTRQAWVDVAQSAVVELEKRVDALVHTASVDDFQGVLKTVLETEANEIVVLPLFVAPGGHIFDDVDAAIETAEVAHPDVRITRLRTLLETPEIIDALVSLVRRS